MAEPAAYCGSPRGGVISLEAEKGREVSWRQHAKKCVFSRPSLLFYSREQGEEELLH